MTLNNRVYDILKWVALIVLPALAKLIAGVFGVWDIPYGPQIAETIEYVQLFLAAVLMVSHVQYIKRETFSSDDIKEITQEDDDDVH